jgi:dipeptidyl aminopeptidase/acylaminoacyl peptidase
MDPLYDLHTWSKHYREEALREAQQRHLQQERVSGQPVSMRSTFRLATSAALMAVIVALLLTLATVKPAEAKVAGFSEGHGPIAFEKDGDIWVVSIMHLENLTPNTAHSNDVDPAVSPDGRYVAFTSDRDGDFEIYTANVFTGEVERLTNNTVYDYNPGWSLDGRMITYEEPLSSPEEVRIFSLRITHEVPLSSI